MDLSPADRTIQQLTEENQQLRSRLAELDVTSRKQAEEDLHRLTRHARCSLWKSTVTGLAGWDTPEALEDGPKFMRWEGKIFDLEAARAVIDIEVGPGERYEDVWCRSRVPEDHQRMGRMALLAMQRGDRTYEQEFRCRDRHGRIQWLYESVTLVPLERGRWQAFGAVVNISAQKATEEALRTSELRFRKVFEESALGMALVGMDHGFRGVNPRFCQMLGYSEEELKQRTFEQITHPDDLVLGDEPARRLAKGEISTFSLEKRYLRKDGQVLWANLATSMIHDAAGRPIYALATIEDITQRKRAAEELERARAAAEAANRAKDQFIAVLSHELRTPLTPALAAVSVLESDTRLPSDARDDLAMIRRNIDLEVRLIADLLDISRVISGKLHLDRRPVDVAAAIRDAARIVSSDLAAKDQALSIETPGAPYFMMADPARLQQVFWNLLRNATKFAPHGGAIAIRALRVPQGNCPLGGAGTCPVGMGQCPLPPGRDGGGRACEGNLVVRVSDTGRGIAPELLPRLFQPFEQGHDARRLGGLGLGLAICKAVVEMHGGNIVAHSEGVGKGATFTLRLPVARCSTPRTQAPALAPVQKAQSAGGGKPVSLRILLVEDNHDTALTLQRLLRARGHAVRVAGDVLSALQAVAAQMPDLLISDIGLPDGTGLELMQQISSLRAGVPAIALSGYGREEDVRRSKEAGFYRHLTKPIDPARLYEAIEEAMVSANAGQ